MPDVCCKACGYVLGEPEEELHDPEGLSDIAQERFPEGNESEDAHLVVRDGEKGWRYYCSETGQTTSIVPYNPDQPEGEGEGPPPKSEPNQERRPQGEVYDFKEQQSAMEVLRETIENPAYELSEGHINEIEEWAEIYDGQLPPDNLESILRNLKGVSKQRAQLVRQKYEARLNKWVREQSEDDGGPQIGMLSPQPSTGTDRTRGGQSRRRRSRSSSGEGKKEESDSGVDTDSNGREVTLTESLREERRRRRIERRNNAADTAVETIAEEAADEIAKEIAHNMGMGLSLVRKVLHSKAEKDPDWFLEKADEWDIDILQELMEPSEARKREMKNQQRQPEADAEVDQALQQTVSEREEPEQEPPPEQDSLMDIREEAEQVEEVDEEQEEQYDEVFGDMETQAEG